MRAAGLGLGGSLQNAIVLDEFKVLNSEGLRYDNEFVRHKVLDAIGDIYLLGHPLIGQYTAYKSGHGLNNQLARALLARPDAFEIVTFKDEATVPTAFQDSAPSSPRDPRPVPAVPGARHDRRGGDPATCSRRTAATCASSARSSSTRSTCWPACWCSSLFERLLLAGLRRQATTGARGSDPPREPLARRLQRPVGQAVAPTGCNGAGSTLISLNFQVFSRAAAGRPELARAPVFQ